MKRLTLLLACIALVALSYASLAAQNKLLESVRHETDVDKVYNAINNVEWSNANLSVVRNLWKEDLAKYAKVPRSARDNDIIRLALANVLIQATRHCRISGINMDELHEFVLSRTKSNNVSVRGRATHLLGLAGYDSDIPFLVSVVESEKEGYAEGAALSITFIHSDAGLNALRNLAKKVSRPSLKTFLQEMVEAYQAYPLKERAKGCVSES
jgi:HEAT repeat protein